jgi:HAD superfamily hydrolase (TIGR01509 family)
MDRHPILLFDVMNTLVHEPFYHEVPAFFGLSLRELMAVKHPTAWVEFELGRLTEGEFLASFFRDGRAFDGAELVRVMRAAYRWMPGMEELLRTLSARGYAIHALSNYPEWYRLIDERLRLSRFLDWSFVSCRTGVRKPDAAAYLDAAAMLAVEPGQCLFVDDREANCAAARAQGMPAVRFTGAPELGAELAQRGLLAAG